MSQWRPQQHVQVKVIGVCTNRDKLLAMEVHDDGGKVKGVRPLGGVVEFGETRETALRREFSEELDTEIELSGRWRTFENLFVHGGKRGHEYIFAMGIRLLSTELYSKEVIVFSEDSGDTCKARWFDIAALKRGDVELFPTGLRDVL